MDKKIVEHIGKPIYYIPITDTTLELSVFWPFVTESRINELRFFLSPYHYPLKRG